MGQLWKVDREGAAGQMLIRGILAQSVQLNRGVLDTGGAGVDIKEVWDAADLLCSPPH